MDGGLGDLVFGDVVSDGLVRLSARRCAGCGRYDDVADVEVLVDVDVVLDLLSEPQPTSARLSAVVAIAAVKYFINCISRRNGSAPAPSTSH